ncbi:homolog to nuoA protein [Natrialba magadii ATCC 43099]|uniref:Homolog to nuoA protein n=1 Tax=Natrialba magadii (strain ATCC 43099 / DSM 3394 / CCM 3739 / CIP 104546 / IAM 13178 / JCM 8861 / NBRC 102185 / NCIMB 2190 / MS3) TaxID=547559 RepID=D3SR26_NATMM|nr:hypothetical protein [Natrialba magadii]ADD06582.1 homolog to nuoA protein [Natrialba magadii ATCC 43099]
MESPSGNSTGSTRHERVDLVLVAIFWLFFALLTATVATVVLSIAGVDGETYFTEVYVGMVLLGLIWYVLAGRSIRA